MGYFGYPRYLCAIGLIVNNKFNELPENFFFEFVYKLFGKTWKSGFYWINFPSSIVFRCRGTGGKRNYFFNVRKIRGDLVRFANGNQHFRRKMFSPNFFMLKIRKKWIFNIENFRLWGQCENIISRWGHIFSKIFRDFPNFPIFDFELI